MIGQKPIDGIGNFRMVKILQGDTSEKTQKPGTGSLPFPPPDNGHALNKIGMQFDELEIFKQGFCAAGRKLSFNGQKQPEIAAGFSNMLLQYPAQLPGMARNHTVKELDRNYVSGFLNPISAHPSHLISLEPV